MRPETRVATSSKQTSKQTKGKNIFQFSQTSFYQKSHHFKKICTKPLQTLKKYFGAMFKRN